MVASNSAAMAKFTPFRAMEASPVLVGAMNWPVGVNTAYQLTSGVGGNRVPTANPAGFGFY
jgi:hypothetical protein